MRVCLISFLFCFITINFFAQDKANLQKNKFKLPKIKPIVAFQLWNSYSSHGKLYNPETQAYETIENSSNIFIRRIRFGFKGQANANLEFSFLGAIDMIGRDPKSGLVGGSNNGAFPSIGLWDAYFSWRLKKNREAFYLIGGYIPTAIGKESSNSAFSVSSMEKSMSQFYINQHLTQKPTGRTVGFSIGGLWKFKNHKTGLRYQLGIYNPPPTIGNNTTSLFAGRIMFWFGNPEQKTFKLKSDINFFSQRNGLSLGLAGSWQGKNDVFISSSTIGIDWLFNFDNLNVDGEWFILKRKGKHKVTDDLPKFFRYRSQTGFIRFSYNIPIGKKYFIEPVYMMMQFDGGQNLQEQSNAAAVKSFAGEDYTYDFGINWYLNRKKLKVQLHYTWRKGSRGQAKKGASFNQYLFQKEIGAIQRGNWIGLGLNMIF